MPNKKEEKDIELKVAQRRKEIEKKIELVRAYKRKNNIIGKIINKKVNVTIELVAGISLGVFIGYKLDVYLNTLPIFLFLCTICGTIGAIWNIYKSSSRNEQSSRSISDNEDN